MSKALYRLSYDSIAFVCPECDKAYRCSGCSKDSREQCNSREQCICDDCYKHSADKYLEGKSEEYKTNYWNAFIPCFTVRITDKEFEDIEVACEI